MEAIVKSKRIRYKAIVVVALLSTLLAAKDSFATTENDVLLVLPMSHQVIQRITLTTGAMKIRVRAGLTTVTAISAFVINQAGTIVFIATPSSLSIPSGSTYDIEAPNLTAGPGYTVKVYQSDGVNVIYWDATPVGIGDIVCVAGQSNAANSDQVKTSANSGYVTTYDTKTNSWNLSADPQPGPYPFDGSLPANEVNRNFAGIGTQGSIWPIFGDYLANQNGGIPIGIVSLGFGGSAIADWVPATAEGPCDSAAGITGVRDPGVNYNMIRNSCHHLPFLLDAVNNMLSISGGFRLILWHQGESEAAQSTSIGTSYYYNSFKNMQAAVAAVAPSSQWVVSQDSFFPADYNISPDYANVPCGTTTINSTNYSLVSNDQARLVSDGSAWQGPLSNYNVGNTYRYRMAAGGTYGYCVHMNGYGQTLLGEDWANHVHAITSFAPKLNPSY